MSNLVFSKSLFGKGGAMPPQSLSLCKVKFVGIGTPWKSGAPTVLIQTEEGTQYRIGLEQSMSAIKQQLPNLLIDKGSSIEVVPNVEFMFSAEGYTMTFSKVVSLKPETETERKARIKAEKIAALEAAE